MPFEQMPQTAPQRPKQEEEHVPGAGERLAGEYYTHFVTGDSETDHVLGLLVNRVRDEYVMNSRDAKGVPEPDILKDLIRGGLDKYLVRRDKNGKIVEIFPRDPAEVYTHATDLITTNIDQARTKSHWKKSQRNEKDLH